MNSDIFEVYISNPNMTIQFRLVDYPTSAPLIDYLIRTFGRGILLLKNFDVGQNIIGGQRSRFEVYEQPPGNNVVLCV